MKRRKQDLKQKESIEKNQITLIAELVYSSNFELINLKCKILKSLKSSSSFLCKKVPKKIR